MSDDHEPLASLPDGITRRMSFSFTIVDPEHEADCLEALCEGYVRANQIVIRAQPNAYPCCLTCGGYKYVEPRNCYVYKFQARQKRGTDPQCQHVRGCYELHREGKGTCIDLACALAAFYREKEGDHSARVVIDYQIAEDGLSKPGLYHAMVKKGDGTIVDPQAMVQASEASGCACAGAA